MVPSVGAMRDVGGRGGWWACERRDVQNGQEGRVDRLLDPSMEDVKVPRAQHGPTSACGPIKTRDSMRALGVDPLCELREGGDIVCIFLERIDQTGIHCSLVHVLRYCDSSSYCAGQAEVALRDCRFPPRIRARVF